jgi:hypothetical protein
MSRPVRKTRGFVILMVHHFLLVVCHGYKEIEFVDKVVGF